jgi:hypothetical protein
VRIVFALQVGIRIDLPAPWSTSLSVGVALPEAKLLPERFGADAHTYAVWLCTSESVHIPVVHNNEHMHRHAHLGLGSSSGAPEAPAIGQRMVFRFTADVTTETLRYAVEIVTADPPHSVVRLFDSPQWTIPVPNLSRYHLSAASAALMMLTLIE